jgi:hypothetical protein
MNFSGKVLGVGAVACLIGFGCGGDDSTSGGGSPMSTSSSGTTSSGSGGSGGTGTGTGGSGGDGGSGGMTSMLSADPCAAGPADTTWFDDNMPHTTPETAKVEGVVTEQVVYLEGTIAAVAGVYFYSFCTGPAFTQFDMLLFANDAVIDFVHLHDATGLVFGPEVPPSMMASPENQSWPVQPNTPYVLEVHAPGGGFF